MKHNTVIAFMTAKKRKIKCAYFTHVGLKLHTGELK